jgi:hypothetical protein
LSDPHSQPLNTHILIIRATALVNFIIKDVIPVLIAFSILLTQSSIAYSCEEEDSTPAQNLKMISDDQSGLVFEVASNYRAVVNTTTDGGVGGKIY